MAGLDFNGWKEQRTVTVKIIGNHNKRNFSGQQWLKIEKANEGGEVNVSLDSSFRSFVLKGTGGRSCH